MEDRDIKRTLLISLKLPHIEEIGLGIVKDLTSCGVPLGQSLSRSISLLIDRISCRRKSIRGEIGLKEGERIISENITSINVQVFFEHFSAFSVKLVGLSFTNIHM